MPAYHQESASSRRMSADDKIDHIVYGYNVTCRHISALCLPRCFVTSGVLDCSVADIEEAAMTLLTEFVKLGYPSSN